MSHRRITFVTVGVMSAVLVVTSCANGNSETEAVEEGGSLTIANSQFLEPQRGDALWEALSGYGDENPEVELIRSEAPFAQFADQLNTELGAGEGPDVFAIAGSQFAELADAGVLEPLDDVLADSDINESNDAFVVEGEQLAVTWEQVAYGLVGNRNVMDEAGVDELPENVEELISASEAIQDTGADGLGVRHQMAEFDGWFQDFNAWPYGFGGSWSDGESLTLDSPENVAGLEAYAEVIDSGIVPIGDDASTFRSKFQEGQLGFLIDNSAAVLTLVDGESIESGEEIVSGPLPFEDPGQSTLMALVVNANSDNIELAKDFVRWFVTPSAQEAIREPMGASLLATDVPLDDGFAQDHPWAQTFIDINPQTQGHLIEGHETRTREIMRTVMEGVERVIVQGEDPETALNDAQQTHAE